MDFDIRCITSIDFDMKNRIYENGFSYFLSRANILYVYNIEFFKKNSLEIVCVIIGPTLSN